jgi:2'-5' RNA ligase
MRRIFIAINLPEDVKETLQKYQREWADLPVRFVKRDSLHLTVLFIGYVDDERMLDICRQTKEITKNHQPFDLKFSHICLGPPKKPPRLIWAEGKKSRSLSELKEELESAVFQRGPDPRSFSGAERELKDLIPHITLARIRQMAWKRLLEKPAINEEVSFVVPVNSIEVMESDLRRSGAEYSVLESVELGIKNQT